MTFWPLVAALVAVHAAAADLTVFGFELGKPLTLPECPYTTLPGDNFKLYEVVPPRTCYQEPRAVNGYGIPVREIDFGKTSAPPYVLYWRMFAVEQGGDLIGVRFSTPGISAQDVVLGELRRKYGAPTSISSEPLQNAFGATFDSVSALWRGGAVDVTFEGTFGRLDRGEVTIDLPAATALRRSWERATSAAERKL